MQHFIHPGRYLFAGKSKSGKTTLLVDVVRRHFKNLVDRIIFVCPTLDQEIFDPIRPLFNPKTDVFDYNDKDVFLVIEKQVRFQRALCAKEGIPEIKTLLIVDDTAGLNIMHGGRHSKFSNLAIHCNHLNLSIFSLTQQPKAITPSFRENLEGLVCYPLLGRKDREWLYDEYNGSLVKKRTFQKLVLASWKGPENEDFEDFGKHFLFITFPIRAQPRYFGDFSHELFARKGRKLAELE